MREKYEDTQKYYVNYDEFSLVCWISVAIRFEYPIAYPIYYVPVHHACL